MGDGIREATAANETFEEAHTEREGDQMKPTKVLLLIVIALGVFWGSVTIRRVCQKAAARLERVTK